MKPRSLRAELFFQNRRLWRGEWRWQRSSNKARFILARFAMSLKRRSLRRAKYYVRVPHITTGMTPGQRRARFESYVKRETRKVNRARDFILKNISAVVNLPDNAVFIAGRDGVFVEEGH